MLSQRDKKERLLTYNELKELLCYDPNTGEFYRKKKSCNGAIENKIIKIKPLRGYISIWVKSRRYRAHRLAWLYMYKQWPQNDIDHINHIRNDNRISNLRQATGQENSKNQSLMCLNTSGVSGVYWDNINQKWRVQININRKKKALGRFTDKFEAICVRLSANNKYGYHGNHGAEKR